ncbi:MULTISPECIES: PadR family transcriptional regulator [Pontibacillus]|uniref:PadR family transcriptional regulator n=1 Tax=Pontibacillus chungwhensis TaxID=265426 RepID=A0ABY8UUN1_9BACI|nr:MULTISPECIES: PadR family transcriptional regulator [Pontibacillus]MCD5323366.1 PadR family transcriptional regulator [Pontibacillus sp. HN14]WIF96747.1 PadR family transcriptional regulator [Pontibacillus chungwhensis]
MYELFVLGELMDKPMHGYVLQHVLDKVVGPNRKISWGILYPLIQKLSNQGFIEQTVQDDGGRGRPKKILSLTESGRKRFYELIEEPLPYDQTTDDLFDIKLSNFHHISGQVQVGILEQYKDYLHHLQIHYQDNEDRVNVEPDISPKERGSIHKVLDRRKNNVQIQLNWIKQQLDIIKGGYQNE